MASCGFWLFLLGSRFFLSDLSHQSLVPPAGMSASATGSFRDRGDAHVGSDITELQTPAQERRYHHSAEHSQPISAATFCWKSGVIGSRRLFSETVCIFSFHTVLQHPVLCSGSFLVSLESSFCPPHHKKPPRRPTIILSGSLSASLPAVWPGHM